MKKFLSSLLIALTVIVAVIPAHATLPSGYTELEYIESTGTQYIDTGVVPTLNTTTEVKAKKAVTKSLFGCSSYMLTGNSGGNFARIGSTNQLALPDTIDNSVPHVWKIQNKTAYCDDLSSSTSNGTQEPTGSIYIFCRNENNGIYDSGAHTVYYVKIWDSNESLVRNMIPAKRNSDNVVGMYDLVSGQFFTNAGTGSFTAGPAKCRNLFDKNAVTANGGGAGVSLSDYIPVVAGQPYYIGNRGDVAVVKEYDADKHYIQTLYLGVNPYTPSANTAFARLNVSDSYLDTFQFEAGSTATDYVPFCAQEIKIATTAYNAARFSSVKTDLNNAVATIREIVTKTINQTAAIASLQADKQTRPEDACPAGKKCLLVETEENGVIVPHWFPIIEAPEDN